MTVITTLNALPPFILQHFNSYLLDPLLAMKMNVENKIIPLSKRKIREKDTGKKKEFEKLLKEYQETYERKKIEEEEYKTKIENAKKRPSIHLTAGTTRFTRLQTWK